jgi:hypothetical protein
MRIIPMDSGDARPPTIQEQFEEFHRRNPEVFALLERFTQQVVDRGRRKIGIRMLWERVRWEVMLSTEDPCSDYKINDHYHSRYVRLLIKAHPEWESLFELRKLRAA